MSSSALPDLFHINQNLGAIQIDPTQPHVQFRLYFPAGFPSHIKSIIVMGDFQSKIGSEDWSPTGAPTLTLSTIPEGEIWTCFVQNDLPNGFYEYIYQVTFDDTTVRQVADPCARYGGQGNNHS